MTNPRDKIAPAIARGKRKPGLAAALKAAKAAGEQISKIEIDPDGRIILTTGKPPEPAAEPKHSPGKQRWLDLAKQRP